MDSKVKLHMQRSENELKLAKAILSISENTESKISLGLEEHDTFFSAAISHSYYSIFYAAKALLLTADIDTKAPEVHKKTIKAFKEEFVDTGILDRKLLSIYEESMITADELLGLFVKERSKRGQFTYRTLPQANKPFAETSVHNAKRFARNILAIINKNETRE